MHAESRMTSESRYIHGTDPDEQVRLSTLNGLLNDACLRELRVPAGERILDVGAGLGQLTRAMARACGRPVVGVERSPEQAAEARRLAAVDGEEDLLDLRVADAAALPLEPGEWGSFDLAHARFLLEHVPDPAAVVGQMVRAVRPGGRVVVCDDDHSLLRVHPEPPGLAAAWAGLIRSYQELANDPFVGRRLVELLHGAGAAPRRATWVFFGACSGDPSFPGFVANLAGNLTGAREQILASGLLDEAALDGAVAGVARLASRPDAVIGYAMPWAEAIRRG
jgi:SAM-dependent methyltransferase